MKTEQWLREQLTLTQKKYEETESKPVMVSSKFLVKLHIEILKAILEEA